jgi:hypothetical protein
MGVVAYKNDIIFYHIAKCAGTSIEQFFNNIAPNEAAHPHISKGLPKLKKDYVVWEVIDTNDLENKKLKIKENAFVVSCVRNTYDQIVSHYHYNQKRGLFKEKVSFDTYVNKMYYEEGFIADFQHMQQYRIISCPNEKLRADYILYFCSLKKDMATLCEYLNTKNNYKFDSIKFAAKYHLNKTQHHLYKKYYNENLKSKVYGMFKQDIDFFGYDFENQTKVKNVGFTEHFKNKNAL